ncbi:BppU family phage baseplate upper protein [Staphylococcus epidermidis]|uniref:BppU family phage baseplate upper protein n=3 Tax=Staphylococcus TaxID=1279 RepID=UPI001F4DC137|nr:BppU family phage baseplate upper protein [Staphylococcus epidermidis]MCH9546910.1 BppU family phage baseplate upper protein [Staphylococcus epidermidis]MCH9567654.1 BppU family phage baseplate upper protein [Staphylococcus epidermidis]
MLQKLTDVATNINVSTAENGFIGANFYTEDDGSAYIRITIRDNNEVLNFNETDMLPRLDLFSSDGSIFTNEPIEIVLPERGVIQYKVSDNVIKHAGKMDAKLFLANSKDSVHVANFYFTITDSGMTGPIGKEVHVDSLQELVKNVMKENAIGLLDNDFKEKLDNDLKKYVKENSDSFKGEQGEQGPQGIQGEKGETGSQGPKGEPFRYEDFTSEQLSNLKGEQGPQGVRGINGKDGIDGKNGEPFTYDDFTQEQLEQLKPELPNMENWQKYNFTDDTGVRKWLGTLSQPVETLDPGFYECTIPSNANSVNAPLDINNSSYIAEINVTKGAYDRKQVILIQNYTKDVWFKTIHTNGNDRDWTLITPSDSGWLPLTLKNGYQSITENGYAPSYKIKGQPASGTVYIRLGIKGLKKGRNVVASIPQKYNNYKVYKTGIFSASKVPVKIIIENGDIEIQTNESDVYSDTDYVVFDSQYSL